MKVFIVVSKVDEKLLKKVLYSLRGTAGNIGSFQESVDRIAKGDFSVLVHNQRPAQQEDLEAFTEMLQTALEELAAEIMFIKSYKDS